MPEGEVTNGQILGAILALKQDMGAAIAKAENAHDFAGNVSKKADRINDDLQDHKKDAQEAHGIGAEKRGRAASIAFVALLGSLLGAAVSGITIYKFLVPAATAATTK
jgi:hypothetical protein